MPIYEYRCGAHGLFEELRSISEYRRTAECPECRSDCSRALSAPHISALSASRMAALQTNERSQHEPRVQTRCDHTHHAHDKSPAGRDSQSKVASSGRSGRLRTYTGARPWVIEHA